MPPARSPRTLSRLTVSAVAVVALALGAAGCGGNEDVERSDFQEKLIDRTKIPEPVAACMTDRVYDQFDQGEINHIVEAATVEELRDAEDDLEVINRECFEENPG